MPSLNQLIQDGSTGGGFDWRTQVYGNLLALQYVLDRDVAVATVDTSAAETTVYSYTVVAATLSTNKALRLTMLADYLNNTGGASNLTVKAKYGGTAFYTSTTFSVTQSASRRAVRLVCELTGRNATNSQQASGTFLLSGASGVTGAGSAPTVDFGVYTNLAIDSTADQALLVTVQHGTSDANISFRAQVVFLELFQ
jgi:hypothetical protein